MMFLKTAAFISVTIASVLAINNANIIKYYFASPTHKNMLQVVINATNIPTIANNVATKTSSFKSFCKKNNMDTTIGFMVNMHLPCNTNRFFVVSFKTGKILYSGLVAHGSGSNGSFIPTTFSNTNNSLATSLGKYKIGERYMGQYGLAYKLNGLETTNSNAYMRAVVLHAHQCVPSAEVAYAICQSWGCPTVATSFMQTLDTQLKGRKKPVGLWIYY